MPRRSRRSRAARRAGVLRLVYAIANYIATPFLMLAFALAVGRRQWVAGVRSSGLGAAAGSLHGELAGQGLSLFRSSSNSAFCLPSPHAAVYPPAAGGARGGASEPSQRAAAHHSAGGACSARAAGAGGPEACGCRLAMAARGLHESLACISRLQLKPCSMHSWRQGILKVTWLTPPPLLQPSPPRLAGPSRHGSRAGA